MVDVRTRVVCISLMAYSAQAAKMGKMWLSEWMATIKTKELTQLSTQTSPSVFGSRGSKRFRHIFPEAAPRRASAWCPPRTRCTLPGEAAHPHHPPTSKSWVCNREKGNENLYSTQLKSTVLPTKVQFSYLLSKTKSKTKSKKTNTALLRSHWKKGGKLIIQVLQRDFPCSWRPSCPIRKKKQCNVCRENRYSLLRFISDPKPLVDPPLSCTFLCEPPTRVREHTISTAHIHGTWSGMCLYPHIVTDIAVITVMLETSQRCHF